jgi:hypothetical protein
MENLFKDIQDAIRLHVPEVAWIDMDEEQLYAFGENAPVDYPCVLIDMPAARFSDTAHSGQMADAVIQLKIAFRVYERFHAAVPTLLRDKAFEHMGIVRKLRQCLHGLQGEWYSPLCLESMEKDKRSIDPKIYTLRFSTAISDNND